MLIESITEVLIVSFILNLRNSHGATESARSCWGLTCRLQSSLKNTKKHVWLTKREKFHTALVFKQMQDVRVWCAAATHREQLEQGVLENLPLLVLIGDHGNVDFAEILREEEDQTHRAVKKNQKTRQNTLVRLCIAPLFFHFFDLVVEFTYFSQVRTYQYAPLQPAGPTCLPAEVFLECVSQIVYNYITISHKMSSQSVRLRFFLLLFLSIWLNCF